MKGPTSEADLFDHRAIMEPQLSSNHDNFDFAFNSSNFSDRVLRIEIMPDLPDCKTGGEGCNTIAEWARRRKRRREEIKKEKESVKHSPGHILNSNQPDKVDCVAYENDDGEAMTMIEESPSGDEPSVCNFPSGSMDFPNALRVQSIYISSAILAAKSKYFYKLFTNGTRESDQRNATLRITASEEAALMELLGFIYSGKLTTLSPTLLLDVLMAADKFEVSSCMRLCTQLLMSLPMTTESALLYLELPSSISMPSAVQPLTDAAKEFLTNKYMDISKVQDEVMSLPLAAIEVIFCSNDLQVASEDAVYDLLIKWARAQYPKAEERREIMGSRLARLIRFPHMTCRKLSKLPTSNDLDNQLASKLVTEALFFKAEAPHRQRALASDMTTYWRFAERAYKYRPLKVVEFDRPHKQCIIYLDLKREDCAKLFPSGRIYSQAFHLGSQGFFLSGHCNVDQLISNHCFGLFLGMQEKGSVTFTVDYEFAARAKPSGEFVRKYKGYYTFTGGKAVGYRNLFSIPWSSFMADDSPYFINDILHLRAELSIKQPPAP